jgi:hypothetical protein
MPSLKRTVRGLARRLVLRYRMATWRSRPLPGLIVVGAQKSATSSLFDYLRQHPQLLPPVQKEVHYFDGGRAKDIRYRDGKPVPRQDTYERGPVWYRAQFPRNSRPDLRMAFEATPEYMFKPPAAKRMFDLVPGAKLIAILRNPTERAISHYFMARKPGKTNQGLPREPLPIREALEAEEERLETVIRGQDYRNPLFSWYSYKLRGRYKEQLDRLLQHYPREQLLVLSTEELLRNPEDTLRSVFAFAGVEVDFKVGDLAHRGVARNKTDVPPDVYAYLNDYFRPHNQALYEMLGRNFGW